MKVLIVGGTSFVGRAIAWAAWHHGLEVTVVNRGLTPHDLPEAVERLVGNRHTDLSELVGRRFDVTIDTTAYRPSEVEFLARVLGDRGGHYIQISSVSAYADPGAPGARESSAKLWPEGHVDLDGPVNADTYGPLKAATERAAHQHFTGALTIVRPTFVIGAHDATLRFPYWVERVRRGGAIAVPGPRHLALQYIDARDVANLVVRVGEETIVGAFHVAGPRLGAHFYEVIEVIAGQLAPAGTTLREISPERVLAGNLVDKFPLWTGATSENILTLDSALALSLGLDLRPLSDSVEEVVSWWGEREWPAHWLRAEEEAALLRS